MRSAMRVRDDSAMRLPMRACCCAVAQHCCRDGEATCRGKIQRQRRFSAPYIERDVEAMLLRAVCPPLTFAPRQRAPRCRLDVDDARVTPRGRHARQR